jgi:hypothetical protein
MSKLEVNAIEPQSGTTLTVGASGDTIVIPSGATISNQGTAAGFGPTGAVSWNTTKITANPNPAVTGVGYFADTTSAAFTITLPATPAAGAVVGIADYANTFATNNLTIARNGSNIGGAAENATLFTNGVSVTFVYVDATQGWIVTDSGNRSDLPGPAYVAATGGCVVTSGNFKIHTFTGPGTFTVTNAGNPVGSSLVDYLVVAGGGAGGGSGDSSSAGGAGGYRTTFPSPGCNAGSFPVSVQGYPITVGGGGAATPSPSASKGANGSSSIFSTITSTGGGAGGTSASVPVMDGNTGGSGGGGASNGSSAGTGGAGNTPPTSPSQGNPGGNGFGQPGVIRLSGGGGGASTAGSNSTNPPSSPVKSGNGGAGLANSISGSPVSYAGGGGGGGHAASPNSGGIGGTGGGGNGGLTVTSPPANGVVGTINTGGGGGGGSTCGAGASGGSGIVIIRYKFQ